MKNLYWILFGLLILSACHKKEAASQAPAPTPTEEARTSIEGMARQALTALGNNNYQPLADLQATREQVARFSVQALKGGTEPWTPAEKARITKALDGLADSVTFMRREVEFRSSFIQLSYTGRDNDKVDWSNIAFESVSRSPDPDAPVFSTLEIRFHNGTVNHVLSIDHLAQIDGKWTFVSPRRILMDRTMTMMKMKPKEK